MATARLLQPELVNGLRMEREEFLRRWDRLSQVKLAELIEGTVYVASPLSVEHGRLDGVVAMWLGIYASETPSCDSAPNATWLMKESAPQPDGCLFLTPVKIASGRGLAVGAPELAVEISVTSTSHDFGPKLSLYQRAGVKEYITVEDVEQHVTWRVLGAGGYRALIPDAEGILRSRVFPGLWLDPQALLRADRKRVRQVLEAGLASPEHARFVARQQRRRKS